MGTDACWGRERLSFFRDALVDGPTPMHTQRALNELRIKREKVHQAEKEKLEGRWGRSGMRKVGEWI